MSTQTDSGLSRRGFLGAGAALGASLVLPQWTWAGTRSVAGIGGTTPPWTVWDDEADTVVGAVLERGEVGRVNELLRGWTKNGQPLPDGLPADLVAFIENARKLPAWADGAKLRAAVEYNKKRGTYLGAAYGFTSGMMSTVIPHEARAVYYSKGGADMKRRISRTAKFGYDIGSLKAFHDPDGEMIVTAVKTRMAHAGVRYWLPKSPHWRGQADEDKPISQRDILVTWHSLPTSVMRSFKQWGVKSTAAEDEAFLHSWQVAAHMLGVKDEYIPATWADAEAQAPEILDPVLAPTREGVVLAHILLDLASDVDGGTFTRPTLESITRYNLGDQIAEWLEIPRHPGQDEALAAGWPQFVRAKETGAAFPGSSEMYWAFDEILRQGALWYLAEGEQLSIEIPDMNNPSLKDEPAAPAPAHASDPTPPAATTGRVEREVLSVRAKPATRVGTLQKDGLVVAFDADRAGTYVVRVVAEVRGRLVTLARAKRKVSGPGTYRIRARAGKTSQANLARLGGRRVAAQVVVSADGRRASRAITLTR